MTGKANKQIVASPEVSGDSDNIEFLVRTNNGELLKCKRVGKKIRAFSLTGLFEGTTSFLSPHYLKSLIKEHGWEIVGTLKEVLNENQINVTPTGNSSRPK